MKNITKFLIPSIFIFIIVSILITPNISLAQCVTTGGDASSVFCTEDSAKFVPKDDCKQNDFAGEGIVQCGRTIKCEYETKKNADGTYSRDVSKITRKVDPDSKCDFNAFIGMINTIIKYILILAISIVTVMFVYAGFLFLTSAATPDSRTKAKGIFLDAAIGLIIAFTAFLIIKLLFFILGYTGASLIGF